MQPKPTTQKRSISADWLVQGVLTKIGDIFDRLTGRGWKPSSTLATSELIERMKFLLDSEVKVEAGKRNFVPHNIKLKLQWDKFSTDAEESLKSLEHEFLTAAIDHINDKRYYTHAPLSIEAKPDYFTTGVKLYVSFDRFAEDEHHEAGLSVAVPGATQTFNLNDEPVFESPEQSLIVRYSFGGNPFQKELKCKENLSLSVGRTKENSLAIDDPSISKYHASLMFNSDGQLMVADTGSTNGTFINGERIAYGKALPVKESDKVRFGLVECEFKIPPKPIVIQPEPETPKTESYKVGEFEFTKRAETVTPVTGTSTYSNLPVEAQPDNSAALTMPSVAVPAPTGQPANVAPQPTPQATMPSVPVQAAEKTMPNVPVPAADKTMPSVPVPAVESTRPNVSVQNIVEPVTTNSVTPQPNLTEQSIEINLNDEKPSKEGEEK